MPAAIIAACKRFAPATLAVAAVAWLAYRGAAALDYDWQWRRGLRYIARFTEDGVAWGPLARALEVTLLLTLAAGALAGAVGLLVAAGRQSRMPSLNLIARGYLTLMRCTPLLVQLYVLYFMLANVLGLGRFAAGAVALGLYEAAFAAEIFRGGVQAVARGQKDAAYALGLRPLPSLRLVLLPQAMPLILPSFGNLLVGLFKHSSIVTIIALNDLTNVARNIVADTLIVFEIWFPVAACYALAAGISTALLSRLERRARARLAAGETK